ncbi:MAG: hypothetical protein HRT94_02330 [Alphaproteobacteria bacterium]|nr:hypothetical protein [Alphaproteobacteria bacterium]
MKTIKNALKIATVAAAPLLAAGAAQACSGALVFNSAAEANAFASDPQAIFDAAQDIGDCSRLDRHLERTSGAFASATLIDANSRSQNTPIYRADTRNTVAWWVKDGGNGLRAVTMTSDGTQQRVGPVVNEVAATFVPTSTATFRPIR